jgi:hypothetical protein
MRGDNLPESDHIARYCKPTTQALDGQIQATAFMLKSDDKSLSVHWLEYLNGSSREHEITEIRNIYSSIFNRVAAKAKIAILNVGEVREKVLTKSEDRRNLEILYDPIEDEPSDPSHSGIYNLKPDDELIAELILETVLECYSARH